MLSSYLPKEFWYDGMNKAKAGKGYRDGVPLGVLSGPCSECSGTIVALKMNTSSKGFETTSEKVCDTCGLVYQGSFTVLDRHLENYRCPDFESHEDWIKKNKPSNKSNDDVAWDNELFEHKTGQRPNTSDNIGYGGQYEQQFTNINDSNFRLNKANARLARTPQSMKIPSSERNDYYYREIATDYRYMLDMTQGQLDEVLYILEHRKDDFDTRYKMDDIIHCICLFVMGQRMGRNIGNVLKRKDPRLRKIYSLVRDKLSS